MSKQTVAPEDDPATWVVPDETLTDAPAVTVPALPEIPEDCDPEQAKEIIATIEQTVATMPAVNKYTLQAYADLIGLLKPLGKQLDEIRKKKGEPFRKEIEDINTAYMPLVEKLTLLHKRVAEMPNRFVEAEQRRIAQEQAEINREAERRRLLAEQEAQKAREAAEAARAIGNEKEAVKLEQKAERQEEKAAAAIPETVQPVTSKVQTVSGASVSFAGGTKVWDCQGWPKDATGNRKPLHCMDEILKPLRAGLETCPPGIQFLVRMSKLDPTLLNAAYKMKEVFPKPFTEATDYSKSTRR